MSAPEGVASLAWAVREGTCRAIDVVERTLAAIAAADARTHAFVRILDDEARAAAVAVDAAVARGDAGPLAGVPIAVKDLLAVRGVVRTNGSPVFSADAPQAIDATVVTRLRAAGAIIIGTTHMHEMALGPTGVNPAMGSAVNPWAVERIPGGSSSGSGVAVAAGLVPAAVGSDTGGSIRVPAAFCGITGFKPTYGRVSRAGATALAWSLDHIGPLARSAEDAAHLLQAMAGADAADTSSAELPVPDFIGRLGRSIAGWRIGIPRRFAFREVHPEIAATVETAIASLRTAGAVVCDVEIDELDRGHSAFAGVIMAEASAALEGHFGPRLSAASFDLQMFVQIGHALQARHYLAAQRQRTRTYEALQRVLATVDVLALPTTICPPPRPDELVLQAGGVDRSAMEVVAWLTWLANFTGVPAASVPCGFTATGLPIGLQLIGRPFADADVLTLAHAYQQQTDWHLRRPPE